MSLLRFPVNTLINYLCKGRSSTLIGPLRYFKFKNINGPIRVDDLPLQRCVDWETQQTHILTSKLWFRSIYYSLWVHEFIGFSSGLELVLYSPNFFWEFSPVIHSSGIFVKYSENTPSNLQILWRGELSWNTPSLQEYSD